MQVLLECESQATCGNQPPLVEMPAATAAGQAFLAPFGKVRMLECGPFVGNKNKIIIWAARLEGANVL